MRKKPGFREVNLYLTEEQFAQLERYWRYQTQHRHLMQAATDLLVEALARKPPPPAQRPTQER